jgi:lysophospholipase L1-like esterase
MAKERTMASWRSASLAVVMLSSLFSGRSLQAQQYLPVEKGVDPSFAKVIDDPALPRVLIIGDSISMGYTPPLRELLKGKVNVHRIPENGHATVDGLKKLDEWLGDTKWDLIHFNFGLHDLKKLDENGKAVASPDQGHYHVPLDEYENNLRELVKRLEKSGARLVWRNTTPVPEGTGFRAAGDEKKYNAVAEKIMKEHRITIDDHWSAVKKYPEWQRPQNVHFPAKGSRALAELAAKTILAELEKGEEPASAK